MKLWTKTKIYNNTTNMTWITNLIKRMISKRQYQKLGNFELSSLMVQYGTRFKININMLLFVKIHPVMTKLGEQFIAFVTLWPPTQWITSLFVLIFLYWKAGTWYNQYLADKGGWLTTKSRIALISADLIINIALGMYYMQYRESIMGQIMLRCPIAISPVIFLLELLCFYLYCRFWKQKPLFPKTTDKNSHKNT